MCSAMRNGLFISYDSDWNWKGMTAMRMEEYLETLTGQIRCRLVHGPVCEELRCHMEEQKEAYLLEGMSEEEAEEAAVLDMGDPVKTGTELDRIHRPQIPWKMVMLIIAVSMLGFMIQYLGIVAAEAWCPFLTYGGTGTIVTFVMLGLLLCVFRYENVMILYRNRVPEDFRQKDRNDQAGERKADRIRIALVVLILFVVLIYGTE